MPNMTSDCPLDGALTNAGKMLGKVLNKKDDSTVAMY